MKIFKLIALLSVILLVGCAYTPVAVDINKISNIPDAKYALSQPKIISVSPIEDQSPLPQNLGIKQNLGGNKKADIVITNLPAKRLGKDLRTILESIGFKYQITEATQTKDMPSVKITLNQFSLNSQKDGLFRHKIQGTFKVTFEVSTGDDATKITKKAETSAERKVFFASQKNLEKTAKDAWTGILDYIANDDFFKAYTNK